MSRKQYITALNVEIQKLNGIIDHKIIHNGDYKSEARRHKKLLAQLRREQSNRMLSALIRQLTPSWF